MLLPRVSIFIWCIYSIIKTEKELQMSSTLIHLTVTKSSHEALSVPFISTLNDCYFNPRICCQPFCKLLFRWFSNSYSRGILLLLVNCPDSILFSCQRDAILDKWWSISQEQKKPSKNYFQKQGQNLVLSELLFFKLFVPFEYLDGAPITFTSRWTVGFHRDIYENNSL